MEVLTKNIRSFKGNVHSLINSDYRKIGLFLTHLGLGDLINMNGAVRYLTQNVDTMYVVCKIRNGKNVSQMFEDEPKIKILLCESDPTDYNKLIDNIDHRKNIDTIIQYFSGYWVNRTDFDDLEQILGQAGLEQSEIDKILNMWVERRMFINPNENKNTYFPIHVLYILTLINFEAT